MLSLSSWSLRVMVSRTVNVMLAASSASISTSATDTLSSKAVKSVWDALRAIADVFPLISISA